MTSPQHPLPDSASCALSATRRPRLFRRLGVIAGLGGVALGIAAAALAGRQPPREIISGSSFPPPPADPAWNSRTPLPPPPQWASPALLERFMPLFSAYQEVGVLGALSFPEWLALNGIVNPMQVAQLQGLYVWYARAAGGTSFGSYGR